MRLINADRLIMELLDLWQYYLERKRAKETMIIWTVITRVKEMAIEEMWKHELSKERQRTANAHPTHECVKPTHGCVDLIRRQAVINTIRREVFWCDDLIDKIKSLPSAQSEPVGNSEQLRPKGKWIERNNYAVCSVCEMTSHTVYVMNLNKYIPVKTKFCPHCGALMEEEQVKGEGDE